MHKTQLTLVHLLDDGSLPESSNAAHHSLAASLDRQPGAGDLHHVGRVEGQVSRL